MRFMSLVKSTERMSGPPPKALMEAIDNLVQEAAKDGCVMVQAGGLLPTSSGMRVRLSGGKLTVTDGLDLAADFHDHAAILVSHMCGAIHRLKPAIGPQVRAADAGG